MEVASSAPCLRKAALCRSLPAEGGAVPPEEPVACNLLAASACWGSLSRCCVWHSACQFFQLTSLAHSDQSKLYIEGVGVQCRLLPTCCRNSSSPTGQHGRRGARHAAGNPAAAGIAVHSVARAGQRAEATRGRPGEPGSRCRHPQAVSKLSGGAGGCPDTPKASTGDRQRRHRGSSSTGGAACLPAASLAYG